MKLPWNPKNQRRSRSMKEMMVKRNGRRKGGAKPKLVLPKEFGKHAIAEGAKADTNYVSSYVA
jgi:hypothetical protein